MPWRARPPREGGSRLDLWTIERDSKQRKTRKIRSGGSTVAGLRYHRSLPLGFACEQAGRRLGQFVEASANLNADRPHGRRRCPFESGWLLRQVVPHPLQNASAPGGASDCL